MSIIKIDEFEMEEEDFRTLLNKYNANELEWLKIVFKCIKDDDINRIINEVEDGKKDNKISGNGIINDSISDKELNTLLNLIEIDLFYFSIMEINAFMEIDSLKLKKYPVDQIGNLEKSIKTELKKRRKKRKKLLRI